MFEDVVRSVEDGVYVVYPEDFSTFELLDFMAPSFVIAVKGDRYMVVFDPRSTTISGFYDELEEEAGDMRKAFESILGRKVKVARKQIEEEDPVGSVKEDVQFYEEMGVKILEANGEPLVSRREFRKIVERFGIFNLISNFTKRIRYSFENPMIAVSPGMAGMSFFTTLDTRFMIWLRNATGIEGDKFRYAMIRIFNVVVTKLARKYHYEKMNILPYEIMIIPSRSEEKLRNFFKTVEIINDNIGDFLADNFARWVSEMNVSFDRSDILESLKSKEEFLDAIASIPDRKGVNHFKNRLVTVIDSFAGQLEPMTKEVTLWVENLLSETS